MAAVIALLQGNVPFSVPRPLTKDKDEEIEITDDTLSYMHDRLTNKPATIKEAKFYVNIHHKDPSDLPELVDLLTILEARKYKVVRLFFMGIFKYESNKDNTQILEMAHAIMERCDEVNTYAGPVIPYPHIDIKEPIQFMYFCLSNKESLERLQTQVKGILAKLQADKKTFGWLLIRVFQSFKDEHIKDVNKLPYTPHLVLQIPDVTSQAEADKASRLLKNLVPKDGCFKLSFPRCKLKDEKDIASFIQSLKGIIVSWKILFPRDCKPKCQKPSNDPNKTATDCECKPPCDDGLNTLAKTTTESQGIHWMDDSDFL